MRRNFVLTLFLVVSACGDHAGATVLPDAGPTGICANPPAVEDSTPDAGPQQCAASNCGPSNSCSAGEPLDACCVWVAEPAAPLADAVDLHRSSTNDPSATPDLGCLTDPGTLGQPQPVAVTGYVRLFDTGTDSAGVKVDFYPETNPHAPTGTFSAAPAAETTTSTSDPVDPMSTNWLLQCPNGCSYRQYTVSCPPEQPPGAPCLQTETPYVVKTSDASGSGTWGTLYEYNVYFRNADVQNGQVDYDVTAAAASDPETLAGLLGFSVSTGILVGEVHDCSDIRLSGATVETSVSHEGQLFYFDSDEADPIPSYEQLDTSVLGEFGALNMATGAPVRVSAAAEDPDNPGQYLTLGTYVVQIFPGAVTALTLRGRRPWQP